MENKLHSTKSQRWRSSLGLMCLLVALVVGVGAVQNLPAWRVDLTEDQLYTLTEGSRTILENIEETVTLELFFSDKASQELPQLRDYAKRVRELLEEYALVSDGKVALTVIDPEPFSDEEDRAAEYGLQGVPATAGGDAIYFGLVGKVKIEGNDDADSQQVIGFFNPERESFLEYDISQLIYRLANSSPIVVGLLTDVSAVGGYDYVRRQPSETWLVIEQLQKLATVRKLDSQLDAIDQDVDVLMVIHPSGLPEKTLYAIDQYVLAGGKAMVYVDPHFEMAAGGMMAMPATNSSDLPELFKVWGVEYDPLQVIGDAKWAMRLSSGDDSLPLPHLGVLALQSESLLADDITTANLESINVATVGAIKASGEAQTRFTSLLTSSDLAMPMASSQFVTLRDHGQLLKKFEPTGEVFTFAARVQGPAVSAFPGGKPKEEEADGLGSAEGSDASAEGTTHSDPDTSSSESQGDVAHLSESQGDINVIIVADTDILTDRLWVQVSNFFGQRVAAPWANNGDFIINVVENLGGSKELISVRSRGKYSRPFERVEALELTAAKRFREQEQLLIEKLEGLESKIQQLSQDESGKAVLKLGDEQQVEIKAFEQEKLKIRKELRQVQHQLNKDIEALERQMKLVNIALVPGFLTLGVIGLAFARSRRRR